MTPTPQPMTNPAKANTNTKTVPRRLLAFGAAVAVVLSAGACSTTSGKKAEANSEVGSTVPDSSEQSPSSAASGTSTTDPGSTGSGITSTSTGGADDDSQVIGTSKGQHPADPNDSTPVPLRLDVHTVKRLSGETIEVRFSVTNTGSAGDPTFSPYSQLGDPTMKGSNYDVGGMALLDRPHDKKYLTLFGTDKVCLCTSDLGNTDIAPGKSASMYADLTAPPESVSTVDLSLPGFAPITGLKIR